MLTEETANQWVSIKEIQSEMNNIREHLKNNYTNLTPAENEEYKIRYSSLMREVIYT